jgi:DNA-binding NtrC family response regulator
MIDSNGLNISESHTASECSASNHQEAVASMAQLTHKEYIQLCEREYFSELLSQTNGNISKISAITGLHVSGIYKKFEKLGIDYREYKKK